MHLYKEHQWHDLSIGPASALPLQARQLSAATVALARAAVRLLDLRQHSASHPRLGVVDHITVQPAGGAATLDAAADVARAVGVTLECLIGYTALQ